MAGLGFLAAVDEAIAAATAETLLQVVAPTNQRIRIKRWSVSANWDTGTEEPISVELLYQTTAGTASALTLVKTNPADSETIQSTAQQDFTAEPTAGNIIVQKYVTRGYEYTWPEGKGPLVAGAGRMGIRATSPSGAPAVNVRAELECEE